MKERKIEKQWEKKWAICWDGEIDTLFDMEITCLMQCDWGIIYMIEGWWLCTCPSSLVLINICSTFRHRTASWGLPGVGALEDSMIWREKGGNVSRKTAEICQNLQSYGWKVRSFNSLLHCFEDIFSQE